MGRMRNENHFIFDRFLLLLLHCQQHTTSKLVMSLFHWPDCSLGVSQPGGRGGKYGCIGLAEWGEGVVWRGPNGATEMFKVSGRRWERCADGEGVGGACLLVHRGNMLAVGGQGGGGGGYSTKVRKLKIEMKKIRLCASEIPDMPIGCGQSCCISDGDHLVVMGGCGASGVLDVVQVYSHVTKVWSSGRALPTPCAGGSAMLHQGSVILLGGNHMDTSVWHAKISDLLVSHFSLIPPLFHLSEVLACIFRLCVQFEEMWSEGELNMYLWCVCVGLKVCMCEFESVYG